jgi:cytochrome c553
MIHRAWAAAFLLLAACSDHYHGPAPKKEESPVERGRYLANHVAICFYCHSDIDWKKPGNPPKADRLGAGSVPFSDATMPFLNVANITPDRETGIGAWSDEEIRRAIRCGKSRDGRKLFPVMPYFFLQEMSDADSNALVAYLRSLKPVKNVVPPSPFPPPLVGMLKGLPELPDRSVPEPDRSSPVAYGKYLVSLAACGDCHTPMRPDGSRIPTMMFGGGFHMKGLWGEVTSPNITPDPSGIPHYTEEFFIKVLKTGDVGGRKLNAIMPWGYYHGMKDDDLRAIFAYLKTVPPVKHRVDNTSTPKPCGLCGGTHGLGDLNR